MESVFVTTAWLSQNQLLPLTWEQPQSPYHNYSNSNFDTHVIGRIVLAFLTEFSASLQILRQ